MSSGSGFPWSKQWPEITDERVRRAFSKVARSAFVPAEWRDYADRDEPLPIGEGQTISQPYVVALMTQAIRLQPGERVLEIGTGSGFQTALLCELAWQEGAALGETVYSLERFPSLLLSASTTLTRLGYAPHLRQGDGAAGWPDAAPFDAIIASAAAAHVPLALWQQLAEGGRLCIPVGGQFDEQWLWLLRKQHGAMQRVSLGPVRFVPLVSPLLDDPQNWLEM
jgi:protein-L-isoaspartate(D-aspartate) O-methyltransferase